MEIPQVFGWNGGGSVLEEGPRRGGFRKSDYVTERSRTREDHSKPVEAERDAAVRRGTRAQSIEKEAKAQLRILGTDAEQRQHLSLQRRVVDTNAPAAELQSVQHDVVRERTHFLGRRIEQLEIVRVRRREWMMHRAQRAVLLATEQWEIRDPQERSLVLRYERQSLSNILSHPVQRRIAHMLGTRDEQTQLSLPDCETLHAALAQELRRWSLKTGSAALEPDETFSPRTRPPAASAALVTPNSVPLNASLASKSSRAYRMSGRSIP